MKVLLVHNAALLRTERVNVSDWLWSLFFPDGAEKWTQGVERTPLRTVRRKPWINPLNTVKRHPDAATRFTYWHDGAGLIYASSKLLLYKHASCAGSHQGL